MLLIALQIQIYQYIMRQCSVESREIILDTLDARKPLDLNLLGASSEILTHIRLTSFL